jgi:hypothetical protein
MKYFFIIFCDSEKVIFENFNILKNNITYDELSKVQV